MRRFVSHDDRSLFARTSGLVAWVAVGLVLSGCAASDGTGTPTEDAPLTPAAGFSEGLTVDGPGGTASAASTPVPAAAAPATAPPPRILSVIDPGSRAPVVDEKVLLHAAWGSEPGELGMEEHAARVGPMSFAFAEDGGLVVVDTVNQRLQRFDPEGHLRDVIPLPPGVPEQIVVAPDGALFVLAYSREALIAGHPTGYQMLRFEASGAPAGEMPVVVPLPTGLFRRGDDLLVESRHADLHYVVMDGLPLSPAEQLVLVSPGRPLNDGTARALAAHRLEDGFALTVSHLGDDSGAEPPPALEVRLGVPAPVLSLFSLESDAAGSAYVGLYLEDGRAWVVVVPLDSELTGEGGGAGEVVAVPVQGVPWTDARRYLAVRPDGRIVEMKTDADGVTFLEHALGAL